MADEDTTAQSGDDITVIESLPDTPAAMTASEAGRALYAARQKKYAAVQESAESATEQPTELSSEDNSAPEEIQATAETQEADPEATPPLDLPRSWTKDQTDHWNKLDRATQEFLLEHDRKASEAVRRSQNEAAEQRKAIETERGKAEQVRQQYEAQLPALLATLQQQQAGEFADIQSMTDVEKLSREDPFRFSIWQAQQMKIAAAQQEVNKTQARQAEENQQKWSKFTQDQDKLVIDKIPELADKTKAAKLQEKAASYLEGIGYTNAELAKLWNSSEVFRDARMQKIYHDAALYADLKAKPPIPAAKPVPQVQRPGVSQPRGASDSQDIQNLSSKLAQTGNAKDAAALIIARRMAAARRAS